MKKIFTLLAAIMMIAGSISVNAEVKVKLTQGMFKQWYSETTGELLATPKSTGCDFNVGSSTGMVYGNSSVKWYTYADLSKYKTLVLEVAAGIPRIMFNREMTPGNPGGDGTNHIEYPGGALPMTVTDKGTFKEYSLDITGFSSFQLNAIKGANWQNVTVNKMYLLKDGEIEAGEEELKEYSDDGLPSAPVTSFNFLKWSGSTIDATIQSAAASGAPLLGVNTDCVFGHGAVWNDCYADLSSFERLEMVVSGAYPRLLMNRQMDGSGIIEIKEGVNTKYVKDYPTSEGTLYVIDVAQFVEDNGFMHLQAIKGTNYGWLTLKSMNVRGNEAAINAFKNQAASYVESALDRNDYYKMIDTRNVDIATPIAKGASTKNAIIIANAGQFDANINNVCVDGTISNFVLTDGYEFMLPAGATATTATHTRDIASTANYGTVCLPYAVASDENIQFYQLASATAETVTIEKVDNVAAGTPAIFKKKDADATSLTITGSGVLANATDGSASTGTVLTMKGVYAQKKVTDAGELAKTYYISGDKVMNATTSLTINPFRAYMEAAAVSPAKFNLFDADGAATAINALFNADNSAVKVAAIYGINGIEQTELKQGANIVKFSNGTTKTVIVK